MSCCDLKSLFKPTHWAYGTGELYQLLGSGLHHVTKEPFNVFVNCYGQLVLLPVGTDGHFVALHLEEAEQE